MGRKSRSNQIEHRLLTQRFKASLKDDRRIRVRREGEEIKALVSNDQLREAWRKTQGWYREAKGHRVPPPVSSWIKPQPCGKTSTGNVFQREKSFQS